MSRILIFAAEYDAMNGYRFTNKNKSIMNRLGIKSAWLLAASAIFALSVTILNSCSSDEDYDMYIGDELRTHAAATRSASAESGDDSEDEIPIEENCCAAWALATLLYQSNYVIYNSDGRPSRKTPAACYDLIKKECSGNCSNLTNTKIHQIAASFNLGLQNEIRIDVDGDVVNRAGQVNRALVTIGDIKGKLVQIANHTLVGERYSSYTKTKTIDGYAYTYTESCIICKDYLGTHKKYSADIICFIY